MRLPGLNILADIWSKEVAEKVCQNPKVELRWLVAALDRSCVMWRRVLVLTLCKIAISSSSSRPAQALKTSAVGLTHDLTTQAVGLVGHDFLRRFANASDEFSDPREVVRDLANEYRPVSAAFTLFLDELKVRPAVWQNLMRPSLVLGRPAYIKNRAGFKISSAVDGAMRRIDKTRLSPRTACFDARRSACRRP